MWSVGLLSKIFVLQLCSRLDNRECTHQLLVSWCVMSPFTQLLNEIISVLPHDSNQIKSYQKSFILFCSQVKNKCTKQICFTLQASYMANICYNTAQCRVGGRQQFVVYLHNWSCHSLGCSFWRGGGVWAGGVLGRGGVVSWLGEGRANGCCYMKW